MGALRRFTIAWCVATAMVATAAGEDWTSPDGAISVSPPDAARFVRLDDPPSPFLALWVSQDESLRLGVMKMGAPPQGKLNRAALKRAWRRSHGGSHRHQRSTEGHELWLMTAQGRIRVTRRSQMMAASQGDGRMGEGPPTTKDQCVYRIHQNHYAQTRWGPQRYLAGRRSLILSSIGTLSRNKRCMQPHCCF
jgi:hypothetical protein